MSGMAIGIIFFMYATCFWFSGWLINNGHIRPDEFDDIFKGKPNSVGVKTVELNLIVQF